MHEERWALISPPFVTSSANCVNLTFEPFVYSAVRLGCINKIGAYEEHLMLRTNDSLLERSSPSVVLLTINETVSQYAQCSLIFESRSSKSGYMVAIHSVKMIPGQCELPPIGEFI